MFRVSSEEDYERAAQNGVRPLFALDHFEFHDTLLDLLELATARARGGQGEVTLEELEGTGNREQGIAPMPGPPHPAR